MKPIRLEIEGLQSYKDAVEIDFKTLGKNGLFGIFGPTGSGKSSVLDAITLALYGSVTRAERGTHGIMHVHCEALRVCFYFELTKGADRVAYKIERIFGKNKQNEQHIVAKKLRIFQIEDETPCIICDKLSEGNHFITQLLGLNHEDFIRAVVLPQNKFMDFLLMKNAEKTKMLERIFYLEEYGNLLMEKVTRKKNRIEKEEAALQVKEQNLREASTENVLEAEKALTSAEKEKACMQQAYDDYKEYYKTSEELYHWLLEKRQLDQKRQQLNKEKPAMEDRKRAVSLAKEALPILNKFHDVQILNENFMKKKLKEKELNEQCDSFAKEREALQNGYLNLQERSEEEIPSLLQKQNQLQEAREVKRNILELQKKVEEKRIAYKNCLQKKNAKQEEFNKNEAQLNENNESLKRLGAEIAQIQIDAEYKKKLNAILLVESSCERLMEYLQNEQTLCEKVRKKIQDETSQHKIKQEELVTLKQQETKFQDTLRRIEEELEQDVARVFAAKLVKGEPCMVCGGIEHPNPVVSNAVLQVENANLEMGELHAKKDNVYERRMETLEVLKKMQARKDEKSEQLGSLMGSIQSSRQSLAEREAKIKETKIQISKCQENMEAFLREYGVQSVKVASQVMLQQEDAIQKMQVQKDEIQEQILGIQKRRDEEWEHLQGISVLLTRLEVEGSHLKNTLQENHQRLQEWNIQTDVEEELKQTERDLAFFKTQLAKQRADLETIDQKLNSMKVEANEMKMHNYALEQSIKEKKGQIEEVLKTSSFHSFDEVVEAKLSEEEIANGLKVVEMFEEALRSYESQWIILQKKINERELSENEWLEIQRKQKELSQKRDATLTNFEVNKQRVKELKIKHEEWKKVRNQIEENQLKKDWVNEIQSLLRGNQFIDFIAEERLRYICKEASETLGWLSRHRYAIELGTENQFVIRDFFNGGVHRLISSLSGGEIFLTALCLALALSKHIQLKGKSPLEFFFLDEGFGTLDETLLDTVMDALERLSSGQRMIGIITHVPEMKHRIPCRLLVTPPDPNKALGSRVRIEG